MGSFRVGIMKLSKHFFGGTATAVAGGDVRRGMAHHPPAWRRWFNQRQAFWVTVFFAIFSIAASFMAISADLRPHYSVQQILAHPVVARVAFTAQDAEATKQTVDDALMRAPNVYRANDSFFQDVRERLQLLIGLANNDSVKQIPQGTRESYHITPAALAELRLMIVGGQPQPQWQASVDQLMKDLAGVVVLTPDQAKIESANLATKVRLHLYGDPVADRFTEKALHRHHFHR